MCIWAYLHSWSITLINDGPICLHLRLAARWARRQEWRRDAEPAGPLMSNGEGTVWYPRDACTILISIPREQLATLPLHLDSVCVCVCVVKLHLYTQRPSVFFIAWKHLTSSSSFVTNGALGKLIRVGEVCQVLAHYGFKYSMKVAPNVIQTPDCIWRRRYSINECCHGSNLQRTKR